MIRIFAVHVSPPFCASRAPIRTYGKAGGNVGIFSRYARFAFPTPALSGSGSEGLFSASRGEAPLAKDLKRPLVAS